MVILGEGVGGIIGCLGHKRVLWRRKGVFGGVKGCLGLKRDVWGRETVLGG